MKKRYKFLIGVFILVLVVKILFTFGIFQLNKTYNLTEKFGLTGNVVGYGVYEEAGSDEEFASKIYYIYLTEKEKGKTVYFIFGDKNEVKISNYEEISKGEFNIISGEVISKLEVNEEKYVSKSITPKNDEVGFVINGEEYRFKLKPNEKIYFIISEDEI